MSATRNLDPIDARILEILQDNGRTSNRAIAKAIGVTEAAIRKRMRRLLDGGAISHGLVIDISATQMNVFGWVYLEVQPRKLQHAFDAVIAMERCSGCACKTGTFNLIAHMYARDMKSMGTTIADFYKIDGVRKVHFRQVESYPIHRHQYVINTIRSDFSTWNVGLVRSP
ncbi:DNA-binding Lrp family transcriptional regulator [Novosphingobium kunmingense]|uniref:DNA-binding Lrp family transcriptional regulator n=1 Tax=Novosphingobium kunmingense TaxID=1211806 RepID=A0A2N0H2X2_9SPHN|nr:Lrp/AsnC family transcriptional regulator [Novosphingobium kunmingense]PKB13292.1 DNA-binding Lrp family transcriptional regulator [Novosphingobium kunmingense]